MAVNSSRKEQQESAKVSGGKNGEQQRSLRRRAEAKLASMAEYPEFGVDQEHDRMLLHELRLHQLELEMQNAELRVAQETLAKSEARYLNLYDFAPVGYVTVNKAGVILEANHTATALLQMPPGSLAKEMFSRLIFPNDQDIFYSCQKASFATNRPQTCKLRLLRKNSRPIWARLESGPFQEEGAAPRVCRMALIDIDAGIKNSLEKSQVGKTNSQLQKAESLEQMGGALAHHFNNQLTVVVGNLELAQAESPPGTTLRNSLDEAMAAAERLSQLSGSIITYLGRKIGARQPLDVSEICRQTLANIRIPPQVEMRLDVPATGPVVTANAEQLSEMITHILANGLDSLSNGKGALDLVVTNTMVNDIPARHRFPLDWHPADCPYASITVTDNGCGIDGNDIEKLFDPFFTKKFFGRGLGLSIVLGIARAHDGAVTVASTIGVGTVIQVFLPISLAEHPLNRTESAVL